MPRRSDTKRARLDAWLNEKKPDLIDENLWLELRQLLEPVSTSYLRELLKTSGVPLTPAIEGVRSDSLAEAERTLLALSAAYTTNRAVRAVVIESKDRLRWSLKRPDAVKQEVFLWTMTWLENPEVFPSWLAIRRRALTGSESTPL